MSAQLTTSRKPSAAMSDLLTDPLILLQQLVAIPSVNPMGLPATGSIYFEGGVTDWLIRFFQSLNVPYEVQEVLPGRCNVLARIDSPEAVRTVMLDAHQDTVPVDGMVIDPFTPVLKEGRLYGRGSCDVKGGMAAMLAAFARLAKERPYGSANVLMSCTCDEEYAAHGANTVADHWRSQDPSESMFSTPPDVCIVAEPTDLNVVVAHKGVVRWKLKTTGRACHSSRPHEGKNAIYQMAELLNLIQQYAAELPQLIGSHPLCGVPTLSVGRITGGTSVNIVPAECDIEIDRRLIPGERPEDVIPHLTDYLRARTDLPFEMLDSWVDAPPLSDGNNGESAERLLKCIEQVAGPREKQGAWYGTNAASFSNAGVPCVVCGPGSIAQAHTADEWIEVEQLHQAAEIFYQFCLES